jgi:arylsulfatase A-like enzyme
MIEHLDSSVGRVVDKLRALEIADRSIVVVSSDNGGSTRHTSNAPLRAGKGSAYEGGARVPLIVHWPGVVRSGGICDEPVISIDFFPTLLEMARVSWDPALDVDGVSLVPLLTQSGDLRRDAIYWHYPHHHGEGATSYSAVRRGDWKLIEFHESRRLELYNLKADLGESVDRGEEIPGKRAELHRMLQNWRRSVKAQMPLRVR